MFHLGDGGLLKVEDGGGQRRLGVSSLGPVLQRLRQVLLHALSVRVTHGQVELRYSQSLLRGFLVPLDCRFGVLLYAPARRVADAQAKLCVGISLLSALSIPLRCGLLALLHPAPFRVHGAQVVLRPRPVHRMHVLGQPSGMFEQRDRSLLMRFDGTEPRLIVGNGDSVQRVDVVRPQRQRLLVWFDGLIIFAREVPAITFERTQVEFFGVLLGLPIYAILCIESHIIKYTRQYAKKLEFLIELVFGWVIAGAHFNGAASWIWYAPTLIRQALGFAVYVAIAIPSFHLLPKLAYARQALEPDVAQEG